MNRHERILAILLRISGVVLLSALIPAVMPFAWMERTHRLMDMGELPVGPIVQYLTRSLSVLYAFHGALVIFLSLDVRRYLPLIWFLAAVTIAFGTGMLVLDIIVGMPPAWTACEGPSIAALGGAILWLAGRVARADTPQRDATGMK